MNATKILKSTGLKSNDSIFSLNYKEATEKLLEFIKEWELRIEVEKNQQRGLENSFRELRGFNYWLSSRKRPSRTRGVFDK